MPRDPDRIYPADRQRESAWEALDRAEAGVEFTVAELQHGRFGPVGASYSMVRNVLADAVRLGCVELLGRSAEVQGAPNLYRRRA